MSMMSAMSSPHGRRDDADLRVDPDGGRTTQRRSPGVGALAPSVTMQDVGRVAGVSAKTVSRVLNLEPGVDQRTFARVSEAMAAMGYRRNDVARNLRKGISSASVGLLIEDLGNPFYAVLARAVEQVAQRHGHRVTMTSSGEDPVQERELLMDLLRRGANGLLIVPAGDDHRYLEASIRRGVPSVFLDRPPGRLEADAIVLDNVGGARRATEHLLAHGHRRIAFVGDPRAVVTSGERIRGYREALEAAGVPIDEGLIRVGAPRVEAAEASTRLLMALVDPPTAFFAHNNRNCIGILRALRSLGLRRAVVGFDDFELADMLPVPVTVVAYDPGELGRAGAELLFARMAGDTRPPQRIVLPTRLVARGSGEIGPAVLPGAASAEEL